MATHHARDRRRSHQQQRPRRGARDESREAVLCRRRPDNDMANANTSAQSPSRAALASPALTPSVPRQTDFKFVQVEESTPKLKEELAAHQLFELRTHWVLWLHHALDRDWSQASYLRLCGFCTVQGFWTVFNWLRLHPQFHYFLMRESVLPMWEDKQNENGGCFSVRAPSKQGADLWLDMCMYVVGETLLDDYDEMANVVGVSVASSRELTAVKVWHRQRDQSDTKIPQFFRERYTAEVKFLNHKSAAAPAPVSAAAVAAKLMASKLTLPASAVPAAACTAQTASPQALTNASADSKGVATQRANDPS